MPVDRQTWGITAYGAEVRFTVEDPDLSTMIPDILPPSWQEISISNASRHYVISGAESDAYQLCIGDDPRRAFRTQAALLDYLEGDIQIYVAEFATPHLFVHAGVVAIDGRAIIIPGRSFAGKSTLTTSLVKSGATYYSDEYAVLDDQGRVIPYPRRVSLRMGPHGDAGRLDLSHLAPQGPLKDQAISIGLVALLRYDEEGGWDVRELDHLQAIMAISDQTVAIQRRPADTFAILDKVVQGANVIQGTRGDVDDTVDLLLEFVAH